MKKNLFLTFCFACCPGAGQMYLGYTKRGVSFMLPFFAIFGVCGFLDLWIFAVVLPVIWFYAFFDTFSIRNASPDELAAKPDDFTYHFDAGHKDAALALSQKYHVLIGGALIFIGLYSLYNSLIMPVIGNLLNMLPYDLWWLWNLCRDLPTLVVAILIIMIGIRMIRGEKKPPDDVVEFKGGSEEND